MKNYIYTFICLASLSAQAQLFTKTLTEQNAVSISSAAVLRNGDLVIAANLNNDYLFVRTNPQGDVLWTQSEGNNDDHTISKVIATIDSGFAACGSIGNRGYFAKFNKTNGVSFEKKFPFISTQACKATDILQSGQTSYRMVGEATNDTFSTTIIPYMILNESGGGTLGTCAQIYQNDVTAYPISAKRIVTQTTGVSTYHIIAGDISITATRKGILFTKYAFSPSPPSFPYVKQILGPVSGKQLEFQDLSGTDDLSVYAIAGNIDNSSSLATDGKGVVFYLNDAGSVQWAKQIAGVLIHKVIMNADKTVSILGTIRDGSESYFAKLSATGATLEQHSFASSSFKPRYTQLLKRGNGYYAIGVSNLSGGLLGNIVVAALDSLGKTACAISKGVQSITNFTYTTPTEFLAYYTKSVTPQSIVYQGGTSFNPTADLTCDQQTSIDDVATELNIKCYPNPANHTFYIETDFQAPYTYELRNLIGQTVLEGTASSSVEKVSVAGLVNGVYLLEIHFLNTTKTFKIIKY
jgi:hypothetical protein